MSDCQDHQGITAEVRVADSDKLVFIGNDCIFHSDGHQLLLK